MIWTSSSDSFNITTSLSLLRFLPRLLPARLQLDLVNFEGSVEQEKQKLCPLDRSTTQHSIMCQAVHGQWVVNSLPTSGIFERRRWYGEREKEERYITSYTSSGD